MKAVLQIVSRATVYADGVLSGSIDKGLLILLGVEASDTELDAELLCEKISKLRIFEDENGKMNRSVMDVSGEVMVVSNFTLNANYEHGNRPDYLSGAAPAVAETLYDYFSDLFSNKVKKVANGVFGADMKIDMVATGPVTIVMESDKLKKGKNK